MRKVTTCFILFWLGLVLFGGLLAGCGGRPAADPEVTVESVDVVAPVEGVAGGSDSGEASATGLGGEVGTGGQGIDAPVAAAPADELILQRVVYFDYDSSILTQEGKAVVQAHAQHLSGAPDIQIILEGHADERGTREYNLALSEDRAKAVANLMQAFAVGAGRIQTVSYGEERPVALGHDESAWGLNRRVEVLYQ